MKYLVALLLMMANICYADSIGIHLWSKHHPSNDYQNNDNYGMYYKSSDYEIGYYRNTLRRNSFYAGKNYSYGQIDFFVGGITGYKREGCNCQTDGFSPWVVTPIIVPSIRFQNLRVSIVPNFSPFSPIGVIHTSLEFEF